MELKPLLREWRIWTLIAALAISLVLLGPHYIEDEETGDISIGTNIQTGLDLEGGTRVLLSIDKPEDEGSVTEEDAQRVADVLESRINAFGLAGAQVRTVELGDTYQVQLQTSDTNQTQLRDLIEQEGTFEARMPIWVEDTTDFALDEEYTFTRENDQLRVEGPDIDETYDEGDEWELENVSFYYNNATDQRLELETVAYSGEDIEQVMTAEARVESAQETYQFSFPVLLSQASAENVQKIASNYETTFQNQQTYLAHPGTDDTAQLALYVDGELTSSLNMASVFQTDVVTQPSITGSRETAEEARAEMQNLQSILQSGSLPYPVNIESMSTISSELGDQFLRAAIISIVSALIAVGALVWVRYRDLYTSVPIVITGASEVFILLGAWFSTVATLDLASIAGIIAAVGTGVDDQIVIKDESVKERLVDWTKRMKKAFFIIFTAAGSTIGAMAPLVNPTMANMAIGAAGVSLILYTIYTRGTNPHYVAIGGFAVMISVVAFQLNPSGFALEQVRGFAVTTIVGIIIGVTITRPAYAKVIEHFSEN